MAKSAESTLERLMQDPRFQSEWEALEPEYAIIEAMLTARAERGLTQRDLSELTGIAQADISRLENANANPSLNTLKRLAAGLGKKLEIRFA